MKVHLIKIQTINRYTNGNVHRKKVFMNWMSTLEKSDWDTPSDILRSFNSADILGSGTRRVIFNISGNRYRIICKYKFGKRYIRLYICWLGTHREYTELCKRNLQYVIHEY